MRIIKWLNKNFEEVVMVGLLLAMTLIMGIQVCARYIFNYSLSWTEEVTRYLFIWSGFLSVSYCTVKCISIKIEQLVGRLSPRKKAFVKVVNHTFEFIFFAYMIPFAWKYLVVSIESGQTSAACEMPMYLVQAAPFVCFALVGFRIAQRWWIELQRCRRPKL
ncbi:MAG: TRAP transporter small permease [Clostridia bacterium]|nr:TRAP transporter small permease [Clostridia bacterium]